MKIGKSFRISIDSNIAMLCFNQGFLYIEFSLMSRLTLLLNNDLYRMTQVNLFILYSNENW